VESTPSIQHWLVYVATAAGLSEAAKLDLSSDADVGAVWDLVAMTTGVSPEDLANKVAAHYRLDVADLGNVDRNAYRIVPGRVARRLGVVPLRYSDRLLVVATSDPVSMEAERELSQIAGRAVHFQIAPPGAIRATIEVVYQPEGEPHVLPPIASDAVGGPRVLVVDDDPDTRLLLRSVLEREDFRVSEAADGPQAVEMLEGTEHFDVVTLDLAMPEMPGIEVLKKIRGRVATSNLAVVVATASDDPEVEVELFEAGADDYVVKPVDPPRFVLRIKAVLRRRNHGPVDGLFF
jgi:CheY-like chemotaxis protein